MDKDPFRAYIKESEPDKRDKGYAWHTAIGLQAVDGLKTSEYLVKTAVRNIEGEITFEEANELLESYYRENPSRDPSDRTEEADRVSARIAALLSERAFSFTPNEYLSVHRKLFTGIYPHAGCIRDYNITKREWVLDGATVLYGSATELRATLEYDFSEEKKFSYKNLSMDEIIHHLAVFLSRLWQIHVFGEGNTRTTAVFFIKYLRTLGFDVTNDIFAENAWYFRNALVRANYNDLKNGIHGTTEYLETFLRNLLLNESHPLHNRTLHISGAFAEPEKVNIDEEKANIEKEKVNIGKEKANMEDGFTAKTASHIQKLREILGQQAVFCRSDVQNALGLFARDSKIRWRKANRYVLATHLRSSKEIILMKKESVLPEEKRSDQKINYQFKLLYALGMIFVVMGHSRDGGLSFLTTWFPFAGFHVGLFVFCSGYFYKASSEETLCNYIVKKIRKLIVPLYLWNFFYGALVFLLSFLGFGIGAGVSLDKLLLQPILNGHQFLYNMGGWFIIPLFMIEILNVMLRKIIRIGTAWKEPLFFVLYVALGILGNALAINGYRTGWWLVLVRMLHLLPFFGLGTFYKNVLEKYDRLSNFAYFSIVLLLQLAVIARLDRTPFYTPSWCYDFDGPIMPVIYGFLGVLFWLRISRILEPALGKSKIVLEIANNSYSIMVNQFLGFMAVKTCYALANRWVSLFSSFNWDLYKNDITYYFLPWEKPQTGIFYIVAGLFVPIMMQKGVDQVKKGLCSHRFKVRSERE